MCDEIWHLPFNFQLGNSVLSPCRGKKTMHVSLFFLFALRPGLAPTSPSSALTLKVMPMQLLMSDVK